MLRPWKLELSGTLKAQEGAPMYRQLGRAIVHEIRCGRLPPGAFLPSSRDLAASLGINRKTVVTALDDLVAQGWLTGRSTRGTMVSTHLPPLDVTPRVQAAYGRKTGYPLHALPRWPLIWSHDESLRIDEGAPDCRLFPIDALARAQRQSLSHNARTNALRYGDPRGSFRLREQLSQMLRAQRGVLASTENLCVTRGSQMAIALTAAVLVRRGDVVIMESLSYQPAAAAFAQAGARVVPVAMDQHGLIPDDLERRCRQHPVRAVYVTPHHHFPTTVTLLPERRLRLIALARQYGFVIVEDDYDHEYHFTSRPLLPIASLAPAQTIYIGSLSKLTLPALRVGYVVAPAQAIDAIGEQVARFDRQGNIITEDAVAILMENGELRKHIRKSHAVYARRREHFATLLQENFADIARFAMPDGGLAFWLTFADRKHPDRIDAGALRSRLRVADSASFATAPSSKRGLRLGFASLTEDEARVGLHRLRELAA